MDQAALIMTSEKVSKGIQMNLMRNFSHRRNCALKGASGFTLIELMIVVAVVGILAGIAYPSYNQYVLKSRRADARNAVLDLASRQERYFSVNNAYTNLPTALGYGGSSAFPISVNVSGQSYYTLSATFSATPAGFVATATPTSSQVADTKCYSFQVDQSGAQTNLDSGGSPLTSSGCW
ncbi:type IV pilus assembly protein PilE [Variovorax sp. GrIS 2.14]|uniref:type IV pilin protein n=1 Tax=unclassified Variovorax TaxID=663243 RepID=UPI0028FCBF1F|nr:type IV pilin protein [Variovorax sp. PAMC28562]